MCRVLFSRDYFGFETAGLGYLTQTLTAAELEGLGRPVGLGGTTFGQVLDAVIRQLGDNFRYVPADPMPPRNQVVFDDWAADRPGNPVRGYLQAVLRQRFPDENPAAKRGPGRQRYDRHGRGAQR